MAFAWTILLPDEIHSMAIGTCPVLYTPRITLRPLSPDDTDALHKVLNDRAVWQYFPLPEIPSLARTQTYIQGQLHHWAEYSLGHWALEDKNQILMGWGGLQFLPETNETEVAYCLGRPFWGQGFATEAARESLAYGFHTLQLKEIIGLTHVENKASQNVLLKIGLHLVDRKSYFGMECFRFRAP
jgi:ribosomal-protein-alanine N-acetyltransferase